MKPPSVYLYWALFFNTMRQLSKNWLTESHIDLEYKQYILLAYLEDVDKNFQEKQLYPALSDLIEHYRNLKLFKDNAGQLYQAFQERLEGIDLQNFQLIYQKVVQNDSLMAELAQIVDYSMPMFEEHLEKGKEIYEYVEQHLNIEPVGLIPLKPDSGYIILHVHQGGDPRVYAYSTYRKLR